MSERSSKRARQTMSAVDGIGAEVAVTRTKGDTINVPGLTLTSYTFTVPLDYSDPSKGTISLFCREAVAPHQRTNNDLTYLLFLQGGPGMDSPRPSEAGGWIKSATSSFRVILMDQRGTGLSSPITTTNLQRRGDAQAQADYLAHFRADNIVRDAEAVRRTVVPPELHGGRWSVLGQSFGGFCCATYLSMAPSGLLEVMMTGGLPPGITQACSADAVYEALSHRVVTQNRKYYERFRSDVELVQRIVKYLQALPGGGAKLPSGSLLTPRLLQTLGLAGLGSGGGFERLHYLLETFFDGHGEMTPSFAKAFESWQGWDSHPLYALLHEPIYCQGAASQWAAARLRAQERWASAFDAGSCVAQGEPVPFTGEMVFPWMFEDLSYLRPLKEVADLLAERADWPALYDAETLATNTVPVAALSYLEDMYVDFNLATESATHIRGLKHWVTNEYRHSGIRDDGARVFERLLGMVRGTVFD